MSELKYKVGDKVRIKDIGWYNENKDEYGYIDCGNRAFFTKMSDLCGNIATIKEVCEYNCYRLEEYDFDWTDDMIEGLVEEEAKPKYEDEVNGEFYSTTKYLVRPSGYQFVDENGNVINATKIVLEKKKKEYPKTYEECCDKINFKGGFKEILLNDDEYSLYIPFIKLKRCRDAYWKIAGEEMGLGKPWEPTNETVYCISRSNNVIKSSYRGGKSNLLEFPTPEMRDAFYENFKSDIEQCKELL